MKTREDRPRRHQTSGADALGTFKDILGNAPTGVQELTLLFGEREVGAGNRQIVSALVDGTMIYPLTEMWQPGLERAVSCYVLIQERDDKRRGFAMPCNLRKAMRQGEVRPPQSSVKEVVFRKGDNGELFGFAANGKRVIVPKGSGVKITDKEIQAKTPVPVIVVEKMTAFLAVARVKDKLMENFTNPGGASKALSVVEAAGGGMASLHATMVCVGDQYYEAVSELGVDSKATRAQIKAAHRQLAIEYHPDRRLASERKLLRGNEPSQERQEEITREFQVIQASYKRLMLLADRVDAVKRYTQAGAGALGGNLADTQTGAEVLGFLQTEDEARGQNGDGMELVARGLKEIGYPELNDDASLGREVALTLAGWLVQARAEAANAAAGSNGKDQSEVAKKARKAPRKGGKKAKATAADAK